GGARRPAPRHGPPTTSAPPCGPAPQSRPGETLPAGREPTQHATVDQANGNINTASYAHDTDWQPSGRSGAAARQGPSHQTRRLPRARVRGSRGTVPTVAAGGRGANGPPASLASVVTTRPPLRRGGVAGLFLTYRQQDPPMVAAALDFLLAGHFGRDQVFRDCVSVPPGADYAREIEQRLAAAEVLVVVIGPGWLAAT